MRWPTQPLAKVAPAIPADVRFSQEQEIWHLTLDQIESNTGRIANKVVAPARNAGNSTFIFDEGNVLYSKLRPYLNKVVRPHEPGIATTELVPLRPDPRVLLPDFLASYLRSPDFLAFASACVAGAKMPRIIMGKFWEYRVPVPPISEQRRIVEILDQADEILKLRGDADAKADRILPALFTKMFGDPGANAKGWDVSQLGSVIVEGPQNGLYKPATDYGKGIKILRIDSFYGGRVTRLADLHRLQLSDAEIAKYCLSIDDIVVNRVNSEKYLGKSALIPALEEPVVFESNMMRFRVDADVVHPIFVVAHLQTQFTRREMLRKAKRAINQSSINQEDVKSLTLLCPPMSVQMQLVNAAVRLSEMSRQQAGSSERTETLFRSVLQRAFAGELTACWREAHMKELLAEMEHQAHMLSATSTPETLA